MLPIYSKQVGASVLETGLFFSAFSLMTVILRPLVGWGLDRFGRRGFFLAGVGGYTLTMISFAFIHQAAGIVTARILQGVSSSFLWLSASAITANLAGEQERGSAFGKIAQASSRGSIIGVFVGFTILNIELNVPGQETILSSWMLLFLVYGAISLFALFLGLRGLPETRPPASEYDPTPILWSRTWLLLLLMLR